MSDYTPQEMTNWWKWFRRSVAMASFTLVFGYVFCLLLVGKNDLHTWQIIQYPLTGTVEVRNRPGWYCTWGARIDTYPCMLSVYGTKDSIPESPVDDSVPVQFNDGGDADISWVARVATPCPDDPFAPEDPALTTRQREFHRRFKGSTPAAEEAVRSAVRQIIPQTGPVMSSTENQSARKGEFWKLIYDQMREGLFQTKPVELKSDSGLAQMLEAMEKKVNEAKEVKEGESPPNAPKAVEAPPKRGSKSSPLITSESAITSSQTVVAAEVVIDPETGKPVISSESPLKQYDMTVLQFSIIETDYDPETKAKFSEKKKLYLAAERSKAAAIENIQKRFQRVAQGEREVAETEWVSEQDRTVKRIQAETSQERELTVKETKRIQEETFALIAGVKKEKEQLLQEIAVEQVKIAENEKLSAETVAKAREHQILKAGAISDYEKKLLEIEVSAIEEVAKKMEGFKVPDTVIIAADAMDPAKGTAMEQALPGMQFLRLFGLMEDNKELKIPPRRSEANKVALPVKTPEADVAAGK